MHNTWPEIYDAIWTGEEFAILFNGKRYFFQGWVDDDGTHHREIDDDDNEDSSNYYLLNNSFSTREEAVKSVIEATVFEGKNIKQIYELAQIVDY